jgi:hypothetical protein
VLVAVTTVLGHRTHTEAVLNQDKATDKWGEYQAHKNRANDTALAADSLTVLNVADKDASKKLIATYKDRVAKWTEESNKEFDEARDFEKDVEKAEAHAKRFDLAEALLEIGLVITSVTLLTRRRVYWYIGMVFSLGGIASAVTVLFLK